MQSQSQMRRSATTTHSTRVNPGWLRWQRTMVAQGLLVLFAFWVMGSAHAAYRCNTRTPADIDLPFAKTISVPPGLKAGSAITAWTAVDSIEKAYVCATRERDRIGVYNVGINLSPSGYTYGTNPQYTVWKTNLTGVGVAVRTWTYLRWIVGVQGGCSDGWRGPTNLTTTAIVTGSGVGSASGASASCGGTLIQSAGWGGKSEAILVKIGDVSPGSFKRTQIYAMRIGGSGDSWYGAGTYDRKYYLGSTSFTRPTCSTPDVTVDMGKHSNGSFAGVGSTLAPVKFTVSINSCPTGYSKVSYLFSSLQAVDNDMGLLKMTSTSSAKGIGLKLMRSDGSALKMQAWNKLDDYQSSKGGDSKITLRAALYRTGEVSPGNFSSEVLLTMGYE
ncbi:fimbrial protein [Pseudoxanthomonas indica]|uniref:Major type 1 subunit fimbrin (Pilin) n=2 Tax=Pseudoxanthomonas indica TaxID=428993 RepID=A0A1T5LAQ6_9GAMM|nr:fimbrial protein [Pseudoxanthomonas indica]SKC73127.1 major type 1 subunit fimbrin (pilin) [Pseudoxanthomonas indica]